MKLMKTRENTTLIILFLVIKILSKINFRLYILSFNDIIRFNYK